MTRPCFDVRDAVVVITGGTGGIGSATARELLRRGAKVAVLDLHPDTARIAERMSADSAIGVVADVRDRASLDRAVAEVVDRFGGIDVAIANAGILSRSATLRTTSASSIPSTPAWTRSSPAAANSCSSVPYSPSSTAWAPSPTP